MIHTAGLAAVVLLGSTVRGETTCPTPEAVEAALRPSSGSRLVGHGEHVGLSVSGSTLRLQLVDEAATTVLERTLVTSAPCAARAAAAATMVEAMELELWGSPPGVELPPLPDESKQLAVADQARPPMTRVPVGVEVGAAVLGALSANTVEPAAGLIVDLAPGWAGLQLQVASFFEGNRSLAFSGGSAGYQRSWLAVGAAYRIHWRRFSVQLGLSATGAVLALRGDGITSLASATAFEAGAGLDLQARWSLGTWAVWGGVFALSWPANTKVALVALGENRSLPSIEGLLGAGLQFKAL